MGAQDISLTSGMRNNLLSLQSSSNLISQTQQRLSTGKKVNSALDNPTSYFAAQNANNRAADLSIRKDGMSEAIQMVSAANAGISAITALIQAAQGVASAASSTSSVTDRTNYAITYNQLMGQITQMASDSGYRGTNFLTSQNQTVEFGQTTGAATLQISGFNATSGGLNISNAGKASGATDWNAVSTSNGTAAIGSSSTQLETALSTLRSKSAELAANMTVVTTRQEFTDNMINTLKTGADNLTLADMNAEGAAMLLLQTRQSLGVTSLSLASQAAQSVLRLF